MPTPAAPTDALKGTAWGDLQPTDYSKLTGYSIKAELFGLDGYAGPFLIGAVTPIPKVQYDKTDHTGRWSMELYGNDEILPAGSYWLITQEEAALSVELELAAGTSINVATIIDDTFPTGGSFTPPRTFFTASIVRVATTANITIATALNSGDALDGVTLATGDRVLVKNQDTPAENGIYVVAASPARATDFNEWAEFPGATIDVTEGTTNIGTLWRCTAATGGTLGATAITFTELGSGDGTITVGTTAITGGTTGRVLYDNAGVVGELAATTIGTAFLTKANPSAIRFPRINADNTLDYLSDSDFRAAIGAGTGGGDVVGPGSATDNAIARFDSTTGKLLQNSGSTVDDNGKLASMALQVIPSGVGTATTAIFRSARNTGDATTNQIIAEFLTLDGTSLGSIDYLGRWYANPGNIGSFGPTVLDATLQVSTRVASANGLVIRAVAGQSASLINVQNSSAADMFVVSAAGNVTGGTYNGNTISAGTGTIAATSLAYITPGTGVATFLTTPSSANLAAAVTDETGSGALVFANTPTLITPVLGIATATSVNGLIISTKSDAGNVGLGSGSLSGSTTGHSNIGIGYGTLFANSTGIRSTIVGTEAGVALTGGNNIALGFHALYTTTTGTYNLALGFAAMELGLAGDSNTAVGGAALRINAGSRNVALGDSAGRYETTSDNFYINNQDRTDVAGDRAKSLMWGTFAATVAGQQLTINAASVTCSGTTGFSGVGTSLTALNATQLTSGTVPDARNTVSNSTTTTMSALATIAGGSATSNSVVEIRTSTGNSTSGDVIKFTGKNNGATEFARFAYGSNGGTELLVGTTSLFNSANFNVIRLNAPSGGTAELHMMVNGTNSGIFGATSSIFYLYNPNGTNPIGFYTGPAANLQARITHTASSNRSVDITGSNGGNPTITTSAGSLNIGTGLIASSTLAVTGATTLTGNLTSNGAFISTPQAISGTGALTAINLTTLKTTISTSGAATTTLAAGTNGQTKKISMIADGGDCVVTVTNAAWGGAGTATFGDVYDYLTLEYENSKWVVSSNEGVTLA